MGTDYIPADYSPAGYYPPLYLPDFPRESGPTPPIRLDYRVILVGPISVRQSFIDYR